MTPSVGDMLKQAQVVGDLLPTVERHLAVQRDLVRVLQPLLGHLGLQPLELFCVQRLEQGVLALGVPNAAMAARLRQLLPRLQAGLEERGWKVSAIRIRVQPRISSEKSVSCEKRTFPAVALAAFSGLLEQLPVSDLRGAVARLLRHQQKKSGGN